MPTVYLDYFLPIQSTLLILVTMWLMPVGQMFESVALCVCECLIKMSLDLAATPSVGALIV